MIYKTHVELCQADNRYVIDELILGLFNISVDCPVGWLVYEDIPQCMKLFMASASTQTAAEALCQTEGGVDSFPVAVRDSAMNNFMITNFLVSLHRFSFNSIHCATNWKQ